ncbi:MAG: hypothetical protein ACTXOO_00560 [Sodalis sp. (in: enterobacteria)]
MVSCVIFEDNGPVRVEYRRYNILKALLPSDDYAALVQVLRCRYFKALKEKKIPDMVIIHGGKISLLWLKRCLSIESYPRKSRA